MVDASGLSRQDWGLDAVKVLDHLVKRAVALGASDIHVEPKRRILRVRFRVDGVMSEQGTLPLDLAPSLLTRVKVLGRMDMTIRRLPQDGQFTLELSDQREVHLRASTFPAIHGENLVMRLLLGHQLIPMDKLGMVDEELFRVQREAVQPRLEKAVLERSDARVMLAEAVGSLAAP